MQKIAEATLTLAGGLNSNVTPNFYSSWQRAIGNPVSTVQLGGMVQGFYGEGIKLTLLFTGMNGQSLTIVNEDLSSTAAYRITTLTGGNLILSTSVIVDFIYDSNSSRWIVAGVAGVGGVYGTTNVTTTTTNYNVLPSDAVMAVGTLSGSISITLESAPAIGRTVTVKDANGSASSFNITISGNGHNIDGNTSLVIAQSYGTVQLVYNGSKWMAL
jgi:hypothetical protein